jgi:trans-aconitate 2-methyltransferase
MSYLFKDTDIAAQRLRVLADVFAPASYTFLHDSVDSAPQLALDLGCGPGYTTPLLANTTHAAHTIGLDSSEHFLTIAAQSTTSNISYIHHDVTQVPFPTGQSDLIFCRMLLTHLRDPRSIIERWSTQLHTHGLLLLEEVEQIDTELPIFRTYLDILATLLEQQQNQLYIGPSLDKQQITHGLQQRMNRIYHLPVSTKQAATMFSLNIRSWKDQPFIQQMYAASTIDELEHNLQALVVTSTAIDEIEWSMRQIVYERL